MYFGAGRGTGRGTGARSRDDMDQPAKTDRQPCGGFFHGHLLRVPDSVAIVFWIRDWRAHHMRSTGKRPSEQNNRRDHESQLAGAGAIAEWMRELGPVVADLGPDPELGLGLVGHSRLIS